MSRLLHDRRIKLPAAMICSGLFLLAGVRVSPAVEFANITVDGTGTATLPSGQSTGDFHLQGSGATGQIPVRIGASAADDAAGGILIPSVSENGRSVATSVGGSETIYATASSYATGGSLNIATHRAGANTDNTLFPDAAPFDADVAAAYFSFSDGWIGGSVSASSTSTGGVFDTFNLNGLAPGNISQNLFGNGDNVVTIPGVSDTRRQGIMLAAGGDNNNTYALATPTASGDGFLITTKANNTNGSAGVVGEAMTFVFVPRNTPGMTLGRVNGGNSALAPFAGFQSGDDVTFAWEAEGRYRMSIAGQSPSTGALLVTTHGSNDGDDGRASDNVITYQADGNDWIILAQDLANLNGNGQDTNESEFYFDFAFLPFSGGATGPGAVPALSSITNFSKSRTIAWNAQVTELSPGNAPGETLTTVPQGTSDVAVQPLGFNRGDNFYAIDGGLLAPSDGVVLASVREGLRDNSSTGGLTEYGIVSTALLDGEWQISTATANADPGTSTEFNINHAVAFFGANTGFQMGVDQKVDATTSLLDFTLSGGDLESNGVLLGNPSSNEDNFLTITPQGGAGMGWDIALLDNDTTPEQVLNPTGHDGFNYVYLPYDADNLVAGVVQASGSLISSTEQSEFTLTKVGAGEYKLTITGKTPETGMLLLNATAEGDGDNSVVYEPDPDGVSFRIIGVDHVTLDEINNQFLLPNPEDTGFSFAYIDFETPPSLAGGDDADFNGDGLVNGADFLIWQQGVGSGTQLSQGDANGSGNVDGVDLAVWESQFGTAGGNSAGAAAAVPEPTGWATALAGLVAAAALRRPRK